MCRAVCLLKATTPGCRLVRRTRSSGAFDADKDATRWDIQAGIAKNWFGIGNTRAVRRVHNEHKNFRFANDVYTCSDGWLWLDQCNCTTAHAG